MTTRIVPQKDRMHSLQAMVQDEEFQKRLRGILPKLITPERFALTALAIVGRTPSLLECTQVSLIRCMLQSASVGLEIGNELGHAYLVPFRDRKSGSTVCTLILGYRGIVQLLYRSAQVTGIQAQVVRQGDDFTYQFGLRPVLGHTPKAKSDAPITHAYAMLLVKDGPALFDVMTHEEIEAIRKRSRAGASGPWVTDYAEMAKKTVLRRLAKLAPMSVQDQRLVTADERADAGLEQSGVFAPELSEGALSDAVIGVDEELSPDELESKREYEAELEAGGLEGDSVDEIVAGQAELDERKE